MASKIEELIEEIGKSAEAGKEKRVKAKLQELEFELRKKASLKTRNKTTKLLEGLDPKYALDPDIASVVGSIRTLLDEQAFEERTRMRGEKEPETEKINYTNILMDDFLNSVFGVFEEDEKKVESLNNQGFSIKSVDQLRKVVQETAYELFKKRIPIDQALDSEAILKVIESEDDLQKLRVALQGALPKKPGKKVKPPPPEKKPIPPAPPTPPAPALSAVEGEAKVPTLEDLEAEFQKNPKVEFILHALMGDIKTLKEEGFDVSQEQLLDFMKKESALDAFTEFV